MIDSKEPDFAFEKKLGIAECLYGNPVAICDIIARLMVCMQETNKKYGVQCEFFRLDFRQPHFDEQMEFPYGSLILHIKWGSKRSCNSLDAITTSPLQHVDNKEPNVALGRHDFPLSNKSTMFE